MDKKNEFIEKAFDEFYISEEAKINRVYDDISGDFLAKERKNLIQLSIAAKIELGNILLPALKNVGLQYANSSWLQIKEKLPPLDYRYSKEEITNPPAIANPSQWNAKSITPIAVGGIVGTAVIGGCIAAELAKPVMLAGGIAGALIIVGGVCVGYYLYKSTNKDTGEISPSKTLLLAKEENIIRLKAFVDKAKEITYSCIQGE